MLVVVFVLLLEEGTLEVGAGVLDPCAVGRVGPKRYVATRYGRFSNHDGVSPAANSDSICLDTAVGFVNANWMTDEGSAVCKTEIAYALQALLVYVP